LKLTWSKLHCFTHSRHAHVAGVVSAQTAEQPLCGRESLGGEAASPAQGRHRAGWPDGPHESEPRGRSADGQQGSPLHPPHDRERAPMGTSGPPGRTPAEGNAESS